jgi:hypothetical protein
VEKEEEKEHAEDGTNNKLVNPAADNGARHDGGCGRHCAAVLAAIAAIAVRLGHVVSTNMVQAHQGVDVGSNKPTDVELRCTPHHLIDVVDPPVVVVVVIVVVILVDNVVISYDTILYS